MLVVDHLHPAHSLSNYCLIGIQIITNNQQKDTQEKLQSI